MIFGKAVPVETGLGTYLKNRVMSCLPVVKFAFLPVKCTNRHPEFNGKYVWLEYYVSAAHNIYIEESPGGLRIRDKLLFRRRTYRLPMFGIPLENFCMDFIIDKDFYDKLFRALDTFQLSSDEQAYVDRLKSIKLAQERHS